MKLKELIAEFVLHKGNWGELARNKKNEAGDELKNLVDTAYASTELGGFIKNQNDINNSEWLALDWDADGDIDTTIFYRKPRTNELWRGFKIQGLGHDNQKESKRKVTDKIAELLKNPGWWIEASGALRHILKKSCPQVLDVEVIRNLFNDPTIVLDNTGSYTRELPNGTRTSPEAVFGKPMLK